MNRTKRMTVTGTLGSVIAAHGFRVGSTAMAVMPKHRSKHRLQREPQKRSNRGAEKAKRRAAHIETCRLQQAAGLELRSRAAEIDRRKVDVRDHETLRRLAVEWEARRRRAFNT